MTTRITIENGPESEHTVIVTGPSGGATLAPGESYECAVYGSHGVSVMEGFPVKTLEEVVAAS